MKDRNHPRHGGVIGRPLQFPRQPSRAARSLVLRGIHHDEPNRADIENVVAPVARQLNQAIPKRIGILRFVVVARHWLEDPGGENLLQALVHQLPTANHAGVILRIARIRQVPGRQHKVWLRRHYTRRHGLGPRDIDASLQIVEQHKRKWLLRGRRRRPPLPGGFIPVAGRNRVAVVRSRRQIAQRDDMPGGGICGLHRLNVQGQRFAQWFGRAINHPGARHRGTFP